MEAFKGDGGGLEDSGTKAGIKRTCEEGQRGLKGEDEERFQLREEERCKEGTEK